MNANNLKLKSLVLIIAMAIAGQSYAKSEFDKNEGKKLVKISMKEPLLNFISTTLDLPQAEIESIREQIAEARVYIDRDKLEEVEYALDEFNTNNPLFVIEFKRDSQPLEDWMFEDDYYINEHEPVIEDWMFDLDYLSSSETGPELEDWMFEVFDAEQEKAPAIESWMLDLK